MPILWGLLLASVAACAGGGGGIAPVGGGNPTPAPQPTPTPAFVRLWIPNYNAGELRAYARASIASDTAAAADVVLTLPPDSRPNALTFDATGALWVTDNRNARLFKFGRGQLTASGTPTPLVQIDSDGASLQNPIGMTFDEADDLWVAVTGRLEFYVPTNLDDSGPTTPDRVLQSPAFDLPAQLVFDAAGNLWVSNASFTPNRNAVLVFTPAQLAAGGMQVPQLTLQCPSFRLIEGMRFDANGDLWVASNDGLNVTRFLAIDLAVPPAAETRQITPWASLEADNDDSPTGRTVRKPGGMVFDRDGNLFVNSERGVPGGGGSSVVEFTGDQLANLMAPAALPAAVVIAGSTSNPGFGGLALELQ